MTIHRVFSDNLRAHCTARGTIADFCTKANINRQQFNRYLSGAALPNPSTMARICATLGVREEELFVEGNNIYAGEAHSRSILQNAQGSGKPFGIGQSTLHLLSSKAHFSIEPSHPLGIPEGYYFCYFPALEVEGHVLRTLLRVKVVGGTPFFKRLTLLRSIDLPRKLLTASKHEGCVLSDANVSYLIGREKRPDIAMSMLVVDNKPKAFSKLLLGLGFVQGYSSQMACHICLEPIASEDANRRRMISKLGLLPVKDKSLDPIIQLLFAGVQPKHNTRIEMPSLELLPTS